MPLSNLFIAYGQKEHDEARKQGFKHLGVGCDGRDVQVHVFDMTPAQDHALTTAEAESEIEMNALLQRLQSRITT